MALEPMSIFELIQFLSIATGVQFLINAWKEKPGNAPAKPQRPPKW